MAAPHLSSPTDYAPTPVIGDNRHSRNLRLRTTCGAGAATVTYVNAISQQLIFSSRRTSPLGGQKLLTAEYVDSTRSDGDDGHE